MNHLHLKKQELLKRIGHMDQVAGIRQYENIDGLARGNRGFHVWTGSGLDFDVVADRALDISSFRYKGVPLSWISAVGEANATFYESEGLGWLRAFGGGMLATCGLDHWGPPSSDQGQEFGLHGRISAQSARYVSHHAAWEDEQYHLVITGEVRQAAVFGENLVLRRRIATNLGAKSIQISDVVTNEGFEPQPHMILYHFNVGYPLLDQDSQLRIDVEETIARDAEAEKGLDAWMSFQPPTAGYQEQVFRHIPRADENGWVQAELWNPKLEMGLRLSYASVHLPYMIQWKMMGQGMYVLGIEPANCGVFYGRPDARAQGVLPILQPGESRRYELRLDVIDPKS